MSTRLCAFAELTPDVPLRVSLPSGSTVIEPLGNASNV